MEDLLMCFAPLFADLGSLPLKRGYNHHIQLLPGTKPVVVRPYHYVHAQKAELERRCRDMLQQGMIRPSSSSLSAPILLVKKGDRSWRFCVDYRALNNKTVKDKFPIPVVEELLDELRRPSFHQT
jgi:hypothetical protein